MKVAVLLWPISLEGGLATRGLHTVRLFQRAGHDATFFRLVYSDTKHKKGAPETIVNASTAGLRVGQWHLSITDRFLAETLDVLNDHDLLVFLHAAPHVTDRQKAVKNWPLIYTETRPPKITCFSDQFAADLYPWLKDVAGTFEPRANNEAIARHASEFLGVDVPVAPYPFVYEPADLDAPRERAVIWTSGWRRSKGIGRFVDAAPSIRADVDIFGIGRDLDAFRKRDDFATVYEPMIRGAVRPDEIEARLRRVMVSADFTGQSKKYYGHFNRATIEPMLLGAVSAVLPTMVEPNSVMPSDAALVVDPNDVARSINELLDDDARFDAIRRRGHAWARSTFDPGRTLAALMPSSVDASTSAE